MIGRGISTLAIQCTILAFNDGQTLISLNFGPLHPLSLFPFSMSFGHKESSLGGFGPFQSSTLKLGGGGTIFTETGHLFWPTIKCQDCLHF